MGHLQAAEEVFIKEQDLRLHNGTLLYAVYIQGYKKIEHIELQKHITRRITKINNFCNSIFSNFLYP
jgi:hypothetical protein